MNSRGGAAAAEIAEIPLYVFFIVIPEVLVLGTLRLVWVQNPFLNCYAAAISVVYILRSVSAHYFLIPTVNIKCACAYCRKSFVTLCATFFFCGSCN